jgi:Rad3-related DNA helicase
VNPERIAAEFPAPSYRGTQRAALERIRGAFEDGNEVVLVRAPTGSGKSLLARAVMGCARRVADADPAEATGAYYTTPQVSQLEDVADDELLADLQVIRGKNNYTCILSGEETTPVDRAPCARESGYDCSVRHRCPYFSDRAIASTREYAAMTLAYFMRTAGSEVFRTRDVVVVDEAHGLAEWAEMYATIDLNARTVPGWEDLSVPDLESTDRAVRWAEQLAAVCEERRADLRAKPELTPEEAARRDRLGERKSELEWFVEDYRDPESATTWVVDQDADGVAIKPMNPERYLNHTVWERGERFCLLSATILNKAAFCRGVGLDPADVALVDVEHTFPLERRPLYDVTCGKMTYERREETLPDLARTLVRVLARHPEEKGLVHCHSYDIQARLADRLADFGVGARVRAHGRSDRDAELARWQDGDRPEVFLSVKMEEALDLEGDLCRWQVLCKAPFLNTNDSRVARRLEDGQWAWYFRAALRTIIQACGRVVRSPEDRGATYVADASILDVFERARSDMPDWFRAQVDAMDAPDLPAFDPETALAGVDAAPQTGGGPRTRTRSEAGTGAGATGGGADSNRDGDGDAGGRSSGGDDRDRRESRDRSPLADVWDP